MSTRLGPNFTLEEMPCFERAGPEDIARLEDTVTRVLQPTRDRWGPLEVTSWEWWTGGCTQRSGPHRQGGTVDFIVPGVDLRQVAVWGVFQPWRDYVGRWIYEPEVRDDAGHVVQGEHIHMSPIRDMIAADGKSDSSGWVQTGLDLDTGKGVYEPLPGWGGASGAPGDPLEAGGLSVTIRNPYPSPWAVGAITVLVMAAIALHARGTGEQ